MLLARVAEALYWAGRYLERAEDTARIVREHTNLIVDFPTSAPLTWDALRAVGGDDEATGSLSEHEIVASLISDKDAPASIIACVANARENLRTSREVVPEEFWLTVNDLHLYVTAHADEAVVRRSRSRFLSRVVAETQRAVGILGGVMSNDHAYEMLRLGRTIERADMTTRVLDVRAIELLGADDDQLAGLQWAGVLRSLSALQMYRRSRSEPVEGEPIIDFLLHDPKFPRAVRCCLDKVAGSISRLPPHDRLSPLSEAAIDRLERGSRQLATPGVLRNELDAIQILLAELSEGLSAAYFRPA